MNSTSQHLPVFMGTIVIFACGNIAACAGDIDLGDSRSLFLTQPPCNAREICGNFAIAIITHRMSGVRTYSHERGFIVPETEGFQPGIDETLAGPSCNWVGRPASTGIGAAG